MQPLLHVYIRMNSNDYIDYITTDCKKALDD